MSTLEAKEFKSSSISSLLTFIVANEGGFVFPSTERGGELRNSIIQLSTEFRKEFKPEKAATIAQFVIQ